MVVGEGWLVKAVIAETSFVDPACIRHIRPVLAKNLSASVNLREPFGLQLTGIRNRTGIISEEVDAAEGVAFVQVVVDFTHCVIGIHAVGQPVGDRAVRIGTGVQRKSATVAGTGVGRA